MNVYEGGGGVNKEIKGKREGSVRPASLPLRRLPHVQPGSSLVRSRARAKAGLRRHSRDYASRRKSASRRSQCTASSGKGKVDEEID